MESLKKILPILLVAIIFAVGGYFIGFGNFLNQSAMVFKGIPKNPPSLVNYADDGTCWINWGADEVDWEGTTSYDSYGIRHCDFQLRSDTQKGSNIPEITLVKPSIKAVPPTTKTR